jgi:hypothetical protein
MRPRHIPDVCDTSDRFWDTSHPAGNTAFSACLGPTHGQIRLPAHFQIRNFLLAGKMMCVELAVCRALIL